MRVIGGRSRGRRLSARLPPTVRPTSDRVRESIFDILGSQGGVEGWRVVDLFCGSGALGVEALSRGAASVTFVDSDPTALDAVRKNLDAVGLGEETVTLVRAELPSGCGGGSPARRRRSTSPSATRPTTSPGGPSCSMRWRRHRRHGVPAPVELAPDWVITRERRYGGTLVTVAVAACRLVKVGLFPDLSTPSTTDTSRSSSGRVASSTRSSSPPCATPRRASRCSISRSARPCWSR